jgi:hypothetical protein
LEVTRQENKLKYRWSDCLSDFNAPVRILVNNELIWVNPTTSWKELKSKKKVETIGVDKNFYVGFTELY